MLLYCENILAGFGISQLLGVLPERLRQPAFQQAIIDAVQRVTHIAPADDGDEIIGSAVVAHGVIQYAINELDLCASVTGALHLHHRGLPRQDPRHARVMHCRAGDCGVCRCGVCAGLAWL